MKLLIILLLIANATFGQVYYSFETGLINKKVSMETSNNQRMLYLSSPSFYADIQMGYEYKNIHAETNIISIFGKGDKIYFSPKLAKYDFRVFYEYKEKFIIGYEHSCTHPVYNSRDEFKNTTLFRASHDKIFIKYTLKGK